MLNTVHLALSLFEVTPNSAVVVTEQLKDLAEHVGTPECRLPWGKASPDATPLEFVIATRMAVMPSGEIVFNSKGLDTLYTLKPSIRFLEVLRADSVFKHLVPALKERLEDYEPSVGEVCEVLKTNHNYTPFNEYGSTHALNAFLEGLELYTSHTRFVAQSYIKRLVELGFDPEAFWGVERFCFRIEQLSIDASNLKHLDTAITKLKYLLEVWPGIVAMQPGCWLPDMIRTLAWFDREYRGA